MISLNEARLLVQFLTTKGRLVLPFSVSPELEMVLKAISTMKNAMHSMQDDLERIESTKNMRGELFSKRIRQAERRIRKYSWVKCNTRMPNVKEPDKFLVKLENGDIVVDMIVFNERGKRVWRDNGFNVVKWCHIPPDISRDSTNTNLPPDEQVEVVNA